jgi:beta-lactamase regulating signal transducer with metallopeptidase domain
MLTELALNALVRVQIAGSAAVALVLILRPWVRWRIGPQLAYRLWLIPIAAAVGSLMPSFAPAGEGLAASSAAFGQALGSRLALAVWGAGAVVMSAMFVSAELSFRRLERRGRAGPAVIGVWPRLIVPADYAQRFTEAERQMIRRHERAHMRRRDPVTNLFLAGISIAFWFNPVAHLACRCVRLDQELACDAAVLEDGQISPRAYGEALLKAQLAAPRSWLACAWANVAGHPLELRVRMLGLRRLTVPRELIGAGMVAALAVSVAMAVWLLAPAAAQPPAYVWAQ